MANNASLIDYEYIFSVRNCDFSIRHAKWCATIILHKIFQYHIDWVHVCARMRHPKIEKKNRLIKYTSADRAMKRGLIINTVWQRKIELVWCGAAIFIYIYFFCVHVDTYGWQKIEWILLSRHRDTRKIEREREWGIASESETDRTNVCVFHTARMCVICTVECRMDGSTKYAPTYELNKKLGWQWMKRKEKNAKNFAIGDFRLISRMWQTPQSTHTQLDVSSVVKNNQPHHHNLLLLHSFLQQFWMQSCESFYTRRHTINTQAMRCVSSAECHQISYTFRCSPQKMR